jgi:GAF domain-containing protein
VADRTKELATLNTIAAVVSQSLDLDEVLSDALDKTLQMMEIEAGGIYLLDEESEVLTVAIQRGFSPQFVAEIDRLKVGEGFSGRVAQSGQPLVVRDVSTDPRLTRMVVQEEGLQSVAIVPLSSKGTVMGTLFAVTRGYREFTDQDVQLLTSIGQQIGVAIENARLFEAEGRRAEQFRVISEVGRRVISILAVDELLVQMVGLIQQAFNYYLVEIGLVEEDEVVFKARAGRNWSSQFESFSLKVGDQGITGWVAATGEPLLVPDVSQEPRYIKVADTETRSELAVPIKAKEKVTGVINVESDHLDAFDESDLAVLQSLAHQTAIAVENARLFEAERRRQQEATLLAEIAKLISGTLDLDEVLRLTTEYAVDVFDIHCCCIFLYDEGKGTLRPAAQIGFDDQAAAAIAGAEFSPSQRMRRIVFEALQPLVLEDVPSDPHLSPQDLLDLQSALVVPIEVGGRRLGAMQLGTKWPRRRRFTAEEGELALAMANQAAMAIENARLFEAEERRAEQFQVISEVGRRMTSILAADELLWEIARLVKETLGYYLVGIGLIEGDELIFKAGAGGVWEIPRFQPPRLKVGREGITGWVAQSGEPLLVPDVSQEPRYYSLPQASEIRSELAVPLKTKEAVIGVLHVQNDRLNAFDESDLVVLQSLAHQAAAAIENARLYEQAQELAVVEERNRLARDLHDAVTQTLFSASLIAEVLPRIWERNPDEGRRRLEELRELTRGALAEMRTLLLELRPAALIDAELGDLLRQLAESITGRARVPVTVAVEGQRPLPPDVKVALYRIAHEALNNVAKHAGASQATVSLCCTPPFPPEIGGEQRGGVELRVSDDGRGFDSESIPPESLGLGIMRERAEAIGAMLTVESEIGHGTEVVVVWMDVQEYAEDG